MISTRIIGSIFILACIFIGVACGQETEQADSSSRSTDPTGITVAPQSGSPNFSPYLQQNNGQLAGIWVSGSGSVATSPDLALVSFGVEAKATTVQQARGEAATAMSKIMTVFSSYNIDTEDIQTQVFRIEPNYEWNERHRRQDLVGYRVTNTASAKVRDLQLLGILIDKVTEAGGNIARIKSIDFTVENTTRLTDKAREIAVADAISKANQLAALAGVALGKPIYITESGSNPAIVNEFTQTRMQAAMAVPDTPINPGETNIVISVQAMFAIR